MTFKQNLKKEIASLNLRYMRSLLNQGWYINFDYDGNFIEYTYEPLNNHLNYRGRINSTLPTKSEVYEGIIKDKEYYFELLDLTENN